MIKNPLVCTLVMLGLVICSFDASAQENKAAVEYQSLLNMRYYEPDGGFMVDDLQLVFPPQGNQKLSFVITRSTGEEVARVPLRSEGVRTFDAFRTLRPDRVPGIVRLGQPGDYVMAVKVGDQAITTLPFSLKEEKSTDPYNPKKTFVREGPWREFAYFSSPIDNPDTPMRFNFWISQRELPSGVKRALCTVHVMQGGQEIAATRSPIELTNFDWQFFKLEMVQPKNPGVQWLTLPGLTKKDGELTIVVKVNGQAFKSYRAQIRGGQPVRLARNQMNVEPHTDFVATRLVDVSRTGGCEYCMLDLFWVSSRVRP